MTEPSLSELLQQAEQLTSHIDTGGELPRVERSLRQILDAGQQFWSKSGQTGGHEAQASILLGARGLDLMHISHKLESISAVRTLEPLEPVADTDIEGFLRNERENAIITAIEETKKATHDQVHKLHWEQQKSHWEQMKQDLLSAFAHSGHDLLNISVEPKVGNVTIARGCSNLTNIETAYVKVVTAYNEDVLQGGIRPNLPKAFSLAASGMGDQSIIDLWLLVQSLAEVPVTIGGDAATARSSIQVQTDIVKQGRKHLEQSYTEHMNRLVYSQLKRAQLGGVPGLLPLVQAYLSVILPNPEPTVFEDFTGHGVPVWPLIFYCLRAGSIRAAIQAASANSSPSVCEILAALEQYEKSDYGTVHPDMEKKLRLNYKRQVRTSTDPYKRVVYCVLARCDPHQDHTDIITTTDDYLWLKLSQVSCGSLVAGDAQQILTLQHLQTMLFEQYGESHFNAWDQPLLYTSVLLLSGQFEAAIEFLSRVERLRCHAVHIALALHEMNLLSLPSQVNAPMLSSEEGDAVGIRRLNLTRLVLVYTRKFEATDPCEALHYYHFLRSLKNGSGESVFTNCISELVLQSREFDVLLGKLEPDGQRTPGVVDRFKVPVGEVIEVVARDSEKKGLHEDAIKLYDLAKNHDKVLSLLNQLLGQVVHQMGAGIGSQRDRVLGLAICIAQRFKTHSHLAPPPAASTLYLLIDVATFFNLLQEEKHMDALEVLRQLGIVALNRSEVEPRVAGVTNLGMEVRNTLPHILLGAMNATYRLHRAPPSSDPAVQTPFHVSTLSSTSLNTSTAFPAPTTKHLQEQARALVTFAGMIPLRLHADINARLVQLEALIN
ncbi:nuclear pore complex protein Nup93-like [Oratosquilla oratoria]|uniref:nuclear pore complex protein Nup93-like n=1 Tax=Oratosquilla oratoria TaxID=337810 RepID=UPI003F760164